MDTIQERISMLAVHSGCRNIKALAQLLGLNPQVLYDLKSGKTKEISGRLANKIFLVFPEVSHSWLINGEGEMIEGTSAPSGVTVDVTEIMRLNLNLSETIRKQQDTIHLLTEMLNQRQVQQAPKKEVAG